jgi:hypothetical protein
LPLTYVTRVNAAPAEVWALVARPARWHEWAPHLRGAWGLGEPEVEAGRRGVVRVAPALLVPVRVTAKRPQRWWEWKVGPVTIRHRVEPAREDCAVEVEMEAPAPVERLLAVSYGPLVRVLIRRLAHVAERRAGAL